MNPVSLKKNRMNIQSSLSGGESSSLLSELELDRVLLLFKEGIFGIVKLTISCNVTGNMAVCCGHEFP